jgi:Mce-associated membrane protein
MNGVLKIATTVAALLALAGLGAAAFFGFSWWSAARASATSVVQARDSALDAARQLSVTLQTADPTQPEQGYQAWEDAATGGLLVKLQQDRGKFLAKLKAQPTRSSAALVDAALSELDTDSGKAVALVALDVTQATVDHQGAGTPTTRKLRLKLSLNRTDAGWKVAGTSTVNS